MSILDIFWGGFIIYFVVILYQKIRAWRPRKTEFKHMMSTRFRDLSLDRAVWERFYSLALGADIGSKDLMEVLITNFVDGVSLDIRNISGGRKP